MTATSNPQPLAWLHVHPVHAPQGEPCTYTLAHADKRDGWTEEPLYRSSDLPRPQRAPEKVEAPLEGVSPEQLRTLAQEAAWTGRWYNAGCETVHCTYDKEDPNEHDPIAHPVPLGLTDYLSAVQPQAMLALLDERDKLVAQVAKLQADLIEEAARTAQEKLRANQMSDQHRMQCAMHKMAVEQLLRLREEREKAFYSPSAREAPGFSPG